MVRERSGSRRKRGDDGSRSVRYRIEKAGIGARIIDVDARSDERDGRSAAFHGGKMGRGIDSRSSAGNDRRSVTDEFANEAGGHFLAVRRSLSRSDDRYRKPGFGKISTDVQKERAPGHREKRVGIFGIGFEHDARSNGLRAGVCGSGAFVCESFRNEAGALGRNACRNEETGNVGARKPGKRAGFQRIRKEAEFAMGGSGRMQPDQRGFRHGGSRGAG